jgi:hypothetical protein
MRPKDDEAKKRRKKMKRLSYGMLEELNLRDRLDLTRGKWPNTQAT